VSAEHASTFDEAKFRQVLGHYPTGVVVVTAIGDDGEPAGLAIGSFSSVSLDPPLVAFFPGKSSSSWPRIESAGAFCVNILGEDQEDICRVFASMSQLAASRRSASFSFSVEASAARFRKSFASF